MAFESNEALAMLFESQKALSEGTVLPAQTIAKLEAAIKSLEDNPGMVSASIIMALKRQKESLEKKHEIQPVP